MTTSRKPWVLVKTYKGTMLYIAIIVTMLLILQLKEMGVFA